MIVNIILILLCVIFFIIAICAFIIANEEKKGRHEIEKKLFEEYRRKEKAAEIISNANKTKADARTGDHERDFNFMADKLHNYASK